MGGRGRDVGGRGEKGGLDCKEAGLGSGFTVDHTVRDKNLGMRVLILAQFKRLHSEHMVYF